MSISPEEVRHVAALARLALDEDEVERMAAQLGRILEHVANLSRVDTEGVEPTAHVLDLKNAFRPDRVRAGLSLDEVLANAPAREGPYFRVPKMIEGGGE